MTQIFGMRSEVTVSKMRTSTGKQIGSGGSGSCGKAEQCISQPLRGALGSWVGQSSIQADLYVYIGEVQDLGSRALIWTVPNDLAYVS